MGRDRHQLHKKSSSWQGGWKEQSGWKSDDQVTDWDSQSLRDEWVSTRSSHQSQKTKESNMDRKDRLSTTHKSFMAKKLLKKKEEDLLTQIEELKDNDEVDKATKVDLKDSFSMDENMRRS